MSIQYDSTELQNATYVPRYVKHETAPERLVNSIKLARQDGEVIIDDTMAVKYIDIAGVLIGTSQSDLETKIDAFKELISRKDKNLDITWAGGTRRYVCRSLSHRFERDFYNILHVPYVIRFLVPAGYGKDTAETTLLDKSNITATTDTESLTVAGSYSPKLRHKITTSVRGNADVVRVENTATGDYMDVDLDGFGTNDYLEIDEENQTVKKNGTTNLNYRGKFPAVVIGSNSLKLSVFGSGSEWDSSQVYEDGGFAAEFADSGWTTKPYQAQSIICTQSGRINLLKFKVFKADGGTLDGPMRFSIHEDNNGVPNNSPMGGSGYYEIPHANVPASVGVADATWTGADIDRPFLTAGKRYWLMINPSAISGDDPFNYYLWAYSNVPTRYAYGKAMFRKSNADPWQDGAAYASQADGGSPGQYDMTFYVYRGSDGGAASHTLKWQIYYTKKYL